MESKKIRQYLLQIKKVRFFSIKLIALGLLSGVIALLVYCSFLFRDLKVMMGQKLEFQPSIVYSSLYILKAGDPFENSFLKERLESLGIAFSTPSPNQLLWTAKTSSAPAQLLPIDSPLRLKEGQEVLVTVTDGKIESIHVDAFSVEAIALGPVAIAQLSGSSRFIRDYVPLEKIPTKLLQAIIAIEDQRFLEHIGFDLRSFGRALWINIKSRALSQGGSTLTQQLVKNLLGTRQKTISRKVKELVLALLLEATFSKEQILEKYLNEVYFGQIGPLEVHGVAEAASYFYGKPIEKLSLSEIALIAGVIRGPAVYSPYRHLDRSIERRNVVLRKMASLRLITSEELSQALQEKLRFAPPTVSSNKAPYFTDFVKAELINKLKDIYPDEVLETNFDSLGLQIYSTLDLPIQLRAAKAVLKTVKDLEKRYKIKPPLRLEGLLVAADHKKGAIQALVGGRSYAETTFNRVLNMKRQVGSSFKPIAYLAALLKGKDSNGIPYSPAYMIEDAPWTFEYGNNRKWSPRNYENRYLGKITLREAFANSINVAMARIATDTGLDEVAKVGHLLGIESELPPIPSLCLGSVDLNVMELVQVYSTIANRGEKTDLRAVELVLDSSGNEVFQAEPNTVRVFEKNVMDLLADLLRTVVAEGTAKSLKNWGYTKTAYGKTGTTNFSRDAWFTGFSQGTVAVSWVGFDELQIPSEDDEKAQDSFKAPAPLTGAGSALPIWARFFVAAKPSSLEIPEEPLDASLEKALIDRKTGFLARPACPKEQVVEEIFLPETTPSAYCDAH